MAFRQNIVAGTVCRLIKIQISERPHHFAVCVLCEKISIGTIFSKQSSFAFRFYSQRNFKESSWRIPFQLKSFLRVCKIAILMNKRISTFDCHWCLIFKSMWKYDIGETSKLLIFMCELKFFFFVRISILQILRNDFNQKGIRQDDSLKFL